TTAQEKNAIGARQHQYGGHKLRIIYLRQPGDHAPQGSFSHALGAIATSSRKSETQELYKPASHRIGGLGVCAMVRSEVAALPFTPET
ncbi:hypothetical protein HispidOSU_010213, partial [Sigmodon hispidus]